MIGLTFNDFQIGQKFVSYRITVTDAHIAIFAGLSGDFNPLHVDEEFAKNTIFKGRIAHGLLTLSLISGYLGMLVAGTAIAFIGMNVRFLSPVKVGDTIYAEATVKDKIRKDKYEGGIVTFNFEIKNQREEKVVEGEFSLLISEKKRY
jgi:acyl dehydratase